MSEFYTHVMQTGNSILYRGVASDGRRIKKKFTYKPTLYLPSKKRDAEWRTLHGEPLEPKEFASIYDARAFCRKYDDIDNMKVYGNRRWVYTFIGENFGEQIDFAADKINVGIIDIEVMALHGFPDVERAEDPITAITLKINGHYHVFGVKAYDNQRSDVTYWKSNDEADMLERFLEVWQSMDLDIITGWNVKLFDIPYLCNRMISVLGPNKTMKLSPWNNVEIDMIDIGYKEVLGFKIDGIQILDYYDLYRKFILEGRESYTLEYISEHEKVGKKLDYKEQGYKNLNDLYERNHQLYIDYNIQDVTCVQGLEDKLKLLELAIIIAYMTRTNYEDVFSQGRIWDANIYNKMKSKKIAVPPREDRKVTHEKIIGAYVKQPNPGRNRWVVSFDFTSLYPMLMIMYNMSPETLVQPDEMDDELKAWYDANRDYISVSALLNKSIDLSILKRKQMTMAANGQLFRTDKKGLLAELMEEMFAERSKYKKRMIAAQKEGNKNLASRYKAMQSALKVTLNSAYGSIANQHFRFFDKRLAEGVTLSGQLSDRWIINSINEYFNKLLKTTNVDYVIAADTDSVYLNLQAMMEKIMDTSDTKKTIKVMDKLCEEKIIPFIQSAMKDLSEYVNAFAQKMDMKRETLADQGIWVGKKNYILSAYDIEGVWYDTPEIKITGWGSARSDKPRICRDALKKAVGVILYQDLAALRAEVDAFKAEFDKQPLMKIACPTGLNDMEKWADSINIYQKGTPIYVKAALIYNHYIMAHKLQYKPLTSRNKIKYILLKEPNPFRQEVIGFMDDIPPEFELDRYLDKNAQFDKTFLSPLRLLLDAVGWNLDAGNTLEEFFV